MSKRTAHSIFIFAMLAFVSIGTSGCLDNIFKPKTEYRGRARNLSRYHVAIIVDGVRVDYIEAGRDGRVFYVTGGQQHRWQAISDDPTIINISIVKPVDQVSGDREGLDFLWTINGPNSSNFQTSAREVIHEDP